MKIRKNDKGNVREFKIREFVEKLVDKNAINNVDKTYYINNPKELCKKLNKNENRFGVKYDVV